MPWDDRSASSSSRSMMRCRPWPSMIAVALTTNVSALVNDPLAAATILAGFLLVPESRDPAAPIRRSHDLGILRSRGRTALGRLPAPGLADGPGRHRRSGPAVRDHRPLRP